MNNDKFKSEDDEFFFNLLQSKMDHHFHRKKVLNDKSANLLAFTGLILTFQGSLGTFLVSSMNNIALLNKWLIIFLFMLPLILYSVSLFFSIKSYKIDVWTYVPFAQDIVKDYKMNKNMHLYVNEYLDSYEYAFKENRIILDKKAKNLVKSVTALQIGLYLTVFYIFLMCIFLIL